MKILVLGINGMLGRMVFDYLKNYSKHEIFGTVRTAEKATELSSKYNSSVIYHNENIFELIRGLPFKSEYDYVVNCIGVIKPRVNEQDSSSITNAIKINSLFPHELATLFSCPIVQIATDCVYDGSIVAGDFYYEGAAHNATDVYGKTKSLGEVKRKTFYNLRASIIGPEFDYKYSLLEWVLKQEKGSKVNGYTNHRWNGITTLAFAKVVKGIIDNGSDLPSSHHLTPRGVVTKYELVSNISSLWKKDLNVNPVKADQMVNRVLATLSHDLNEKLWKNAGYLQTPSVLDMLTELSNYTVCS